MEMNATGEIDDRDFRVLWALTAMLDSAPLVTPEKEPETRDMWED